MCVLVGAEAGPTKLANCRAVSSREAAMSEGGRKGRAFMTFRNDREVGSSKITFKGISSDIDLKQKRPLSTRRFAPRPHILSPHVTFRVVAVGASDAGGDGGLAVRAHIARQAVLVSDLPSGAGGAGDRGGIFSDFTSLAVNADFLCWGVRILPWGTVDT